MFPEIIFKTPFSDAISEDFPQIRGDSYENDTSFESTLRALLIPRLDKDSSLELLKHQYRVGQFRATNFADLHDAIVICYPTGYSTDSFEASYNEVNRIFTELGWDRIVPVTSFFKKVANVSCFVNAANKVAVINLQSLSMRIWHYLQCAILAYLPWYFKPEDGVDTDEMDLMKSLREPKSDRYIEVINKLAEKYNFRDSRVKTLLRGFETINERREIEVLRHRIDEIQDSINEYNRQIGIKMETLRNCQINLYGLETKVNNEGDESEIMEYFLSHKQLDLVSVNDRNMTFVVKDFCWSSNTEKAEVFIDNERGYVFSSRPPRGLPAKSMQRLLKAIFVEQKLKIQFCAAYQFSLRGNVSPLGGYTFDTRYTDCIPNPHIQRYSCGGRYLQVINEALMNNDYCYALEQCIGSCKSLNFDDGPVMSEFLSRLYSQEYYNGAKRFIQLPDGRMANIKEALDFLGEENSDEQDN